MNAFAIAECHRVVHDRGLKDWKFLLVRGNPGGPVSEWLTTWDDGGKMVITVAKMPHSDDYWSNSQRIDGYTHTGRTAAEAFSLALDRWLVYKDQVERIAAAPAQLAERQRVRRLAHHP